MSDRLKYRELKLHIDADFWVELEKKKLHDWKLEEPTVPLRLPLNNAITAPRHVDVVEAANTAADAVTAKDAPSGAARVGVASYLPDTLTPQASVLDHSTPVLSSREVVHAELINFNTQQQLVDLDKKLALQDMIRRTLLAELRDPKSAWNAKAEESSNTTTTVTPAKGLLCTFADLKTHEFYYCAAFPVVDLESPVLVASRQPAVELFPDEAEQRMIWAHATAASGASSGRVFVLRRQEGDTKPSSSALRVDSFTREAVKDDTAVIAFVDSAATPEHPGWALRNVFAYLRLSYPQRTKYSILVLRGASSLASSYVLHCTVEPLTSVARYAKVSPDHYSPLSSGEELVLPKVTGWVDSVIHHVEMGGTMDPVRLAESSAKLNLGLMKWRMLPELQLDGIQTVKALLLGSGTLGCNIARHLMMWGVTHITMVDRGNVSYSNPVRQTLFELSDVLQEGDRRVKSIAAAAALKRILPSVHAEGISMTIRMPGHRVDENQRENAKKDIHALEQLILSHDVVFLLTDSRESRWLPTLLASVHNKPVINAALGFDSYVVMRHGVQEQGDERVGCYFCNDVVAPRDSLTARSLDQQCTVTRPGVSAIASAIAVEMLASVYNHPLRFGCPAYREEDDDSKGTGATANTPLGIVAHQIRGNVSSYALHTLYGKQYNKCTACSQIVVDLYKKEGADFIIQCLNDPLYLEEITGLRAEKEAVAAAYANWDDDDFDDEEE